MLKPYTLSRLSKIAPKWADLLANPNEGINYLRMNKYIKDPQYCIVGEAHLFKDEYIESCKECREFSFELYHTLIKSQRIMSFEQEIKHFIRHFNKVHVKYVKQKEKRREEKKIK